MASSRVPSTSFIASMPLIIRFISTCCSCTRSPVTAGSSAASSVRTSMLCRVAAQQNDHLTDDFVYIHQLPRRNTLLEEQASPAHDVGCTGCIFDDSRRSLARLFHIGVIARQPA